MKAAAENPEEKIYSLLYLVGQSGLGKTHLLWAMGNEICKRFPEKKLSTHSRQILELIMLNYFVATEMVKVKN